MRRQQQAQGAKELARLKAELSAAAADAAARGCLEAQEGNGLGAEGLSGKALYNSFSDEELLELLRRRTDELGHVPAQKEMFWVYRGFIKTRFEKWPYALKKAGLSAMAGKGGMTVERMAQRDARYQELMEQVRQKAKELNRPPHMFELEEIRRELGGWFVTWAEVLDAAGVARNYHKKERLYRVREFTDEESRLLAELAALAARLGRAPLRGEVPESVRKQLNRRCGTWRNTLYQIGLEPVTKVSPFENTYLNKGKAQQRQPREVLENSLYKLVEPDDETRRMLRELWGQAERLGRAPLKKEVEPRIYSCLIKKCATFRNMLYQIGLEPLNKAETAKIEEKQGKSKMNRND